MGWFSRAIYGVDLDAEQAKGESLDAALYRENLADLDGGHFTQEQFDAAEANRAKGLTGDVHAEVWGAFKEGWAEGARAMVDGVRGTLGGILGGIFGAIPWQLWIVGAVGLFLWMGGGLLLKGRLGKLGK